MKRVCISSFFMITLTILSLFLIGCTSAPSTDNSIKASFVDNTTTETVPTNITNTVPVVSNIIDSGYFGKILAGDKTPYIEFNTKDYEKATADGKVILLYFYTNLNSICISEEEKTFKAFNDMNNAKMIGFKVHFKDDQTTDAENQLASTLQVENSHTKIILKNGKVMQRHSETWDIKTYAAQMSLYLD